MNNAAFELRDHTWIGRVRLMGDPTLIWTMTSNPSITVKRDLGRIGLVLNVLLRVSCATSENTEMVEGDRKDNSRFFQTA